jgi:hypothetical protein
MIDEELRKIGGHTHSIGTRAGVPALAFVAGSTARSGTNFLGRLLLNHPEICRPAGHWELPLLDVADEFVAFHTAFLKRRRKGRLCYSLDDFGRCFGDGMLRMLASQVEPPARSAKYLLHKNPSTLGIEYFRTFFPDGKLIFLVRDGRDSVNSLLVAAGARTARGLRRRVNFYHYTRSWASSASRVLAYVAAPGADCLLVKYEDLHREPAAVLERIAEYLEIAAPREWLDAANSLPIKGSGFFRPSSDGAAENAGQTYWKDVQKTNRFKPVGRWCASWSKLDKAMFNALAGRQLAELGYE